MAGDRITSIRIQNLRTLADVTVDLQGLTVLIGDNGAGKSSIIEACELLRRMADENFIEQLENVHGGLGSLLRYGSGGLSFAITVEGEGPKLTYAVSLAERAGVTTIARETLAVEREVVSRARPFVGAVPPETRGPREFTLLDRLGELAHVLDEGGGGEPANVAPRRLLLTSFGLNPPHAAITRMIDALAGIDVQAPFDVEAMWLRRSRGAVSLLREPRDRYQHATKLERFGVNLANAWAALKNDFGPAHWAATMETLRLGLGEDVEDVATRPDAGGGNIGLWLRRKGLDRALPASQLSDGQLSYLAFVAMARLGAGRSLVAFDEPELHLHPALLMRVLGLFESMAQERPVLLATHSDRLLDGLEEPAKSAVLCSLDAEGCTVLRRPNAEVLAKWLERYRGLGELRAEGYTESIFSEEKPGGQQ